MILQQDCLILPGFIFPFLSASPLPAYVRVIAAFSQIFGCKDQNGGGGETHTQAVPTSEGSFLGQVFLHTASWEKKARNGFKNPIKLCLKGKEQGEEHILMEF